MASHVATATATQEVHPWRAVLRTAVQVGLPSFLVLLTVVPEALTVVVEELGGTVPEALTAWLVGAAAAITAVAAALARIMAIPAVNRLISGVKLSPGDYPGDTAGRAPLP